MKTILNYNDFVNESLNKEDFYKGKQYKVKVLKCDNKQSWYCDSIDEEITVVDDPNPKQWEDGKERWKVIPNGNLHGVNYILKDDCSEPINESLDYEISDIEEVFESKLQDDYRDFFKHVLDLYEVKSPASIKDEKCKKEFFNKIQKGWVKGQGLSEYGKKLMDCECLDDNGECCDNEE